MRSLGGSMTRGSQLGNRKPGDSGPDIQYLDPISNVNTLWTQNSYTLINDGVRQPNSAAGTEAAAFDKDDNEEQIWGMSLGSSGSYQSLKVWIYGQNAAADGEPDVRINVNGSWESAQSLPLTASVAWHSLTFTGGAPYSLPLTTLQVGIDSNLVDAAGSQIIEAMYIEAIP